MSRKQSNGSNSFFFFNDTATTEIYTLSLHDALPICDQRGSPSIRGKPEMPRQASADTRATASFRDTVPLRGSHHRALVSDRDRKSTRLNSSHANISYAVFCLKKKKIFYL